MNLSSSLTPYVCDECHAELALELALEAAQAEHEAEA
jgi:hypothetical protein